MDTGLRNALIPRLVRWAMQLQAPSAGRVGAQPSFKGRVQEKSNENGTPDTNGIVAVGQNNWKSSEPTG
jgi:hypothetical protein